MTTTEPFLINRPAPIFWTRVALYDPATDNILGVIEQRAGSATYTALVDDEVIAAVTKKSHAVAAILDHRELIRRHQETP